MGARAGLTVTPLLLSAERKSTIAKSPCFPERILMNFGYRPEIPAQSGRLDGASRAVSGGLRPSAVDYVADRRDLRLARINPQLGHDRPQRRANGPERFF